MIKNSVNFVARLLVHLYKASIEAVQSVISRYSDTLDTALVTFVPFITMFTADSVEN